MSESNRSVFDHALRRARLSAYAPGEFVGQESFMRAGEILTLARQAGVASGISVLDLCCGVAGPGRYITQKLGCCYLGVDADAGALAMARERAGHLPCRFVLARVPPFPSGPFDVVLLLETILAFADKAQLVRGIAGALTTGGRFAFTLEEGEPLTVREREVMPDADTVWLIPLHEMVGHLARVGLEVRWQADCTRSHQAVAESLFNAFTSDAEGIAALIGGRAYDELVAAHRLWSDWLRERRVRKIAIVAEKTAVAPAGTAQI